MVLMLKGKDSGKRLGNRPESGIAKPQRAMSVARPRLLQSLLMVLTNNIVYESLPRPFSLGKLVISLSRFFPPVT